MGSIGPSVEWTERGHKPKAGKAIAKPKARRLRPYIKAKIDELFLTWLSIEDTQELIASLVEDASLGRSLKGRLQHLEDGKASPSKKKHFKALGSPPLSPSKSSPGVGSSPQNLHPEGRPGTRATLGAAGSSLSQIPRFYFPDGEQPIPAEARGDARDKIALYFDRHENRRVVDHTQLLPLVKDVLELPSFFTLPLFNKVGRPNAGEAEARAEAGSIPGGPSPRAVTEEALLEYWHARLVGRDRRQSAFEILSEEPKAPGGRRVVSRRGLTDLVECVVQTHPGLDFLVQTKEFQDRYRETCVYRILYEVNLSDSGAISAKEFRGGALLEAAYELDAAADVNSVPRFFSYEHFYVIYCKFWELDADHDFLVNKEDLLRYGSHSLTCRVVDRIFSEAPRKFASKVPGYMSYEDFVWFVLSEEDKTTEQSIGYWFRCLDLAGNAVLVSHELEHFYSEQAHRIECLNQEPVAFEDILTQLTDMLHPELPGALTLKDLRRHPRQASNFFNVLFNLKKFFSFEMKDPREKRNEGETDWDRFAREEYGRLSMKEEMAEEDRRGGYFIDETELLVEETE